MTMCMRKRNIVVEDPKVPKGLTKTEGFICSAFGMNKKRHAQPVESRTLCVNWRSWCVERTVVGNGLGTHSLNLDSSKHPIRQHRIFRGRVEVSIPACHAGDPGSISGPGV